MKLTKSVTIAPFQTIRASGLAECNQHFKRVNVLVEPDPDKCYESVIPIHGYTFLTPGSSRVSVGLQNYSCHKIKIAAKSIVAKITATNIVPHSLAPNVETEDGQDQDQENVNCCSIHEVAKLTPEKEKLLFDKIDLSGADSWDPRLVEEAKQLFQEYAHIFCLGKFRYGTYVNGEA